MEAVEARKNIRPANDLIKALGIKELQPHFLKHREFFTEDEIKDYYKNFQKFDADKDGKISAADITRIAAKMGEKVDKQKIGQLMHPKKPSENITFDDFLDIMKDVHHGTIPSDKGFAHLYFKGKDLIKFPSEFRLKEISPTFHSTTSDEVCVLMCFVNMMLKDDQLEKDNIIPIGCDVPDFQKLCDGRVFCHLLNKLQDGLVPLDKFRDKVDLNKEEMIQNQLLCLTGATNYGCDVKDIDAIDLANRVEYRQLAFLSQVHQIAKSKINNLDSQIEDFAKQMKEARREKEQSQREQEKAQPQEGKEVKPKKARGERRREWRQRTGMKKKAAKDVSKFVEGTDPEEFFIGWCNFHLKKFHVEVNNLGLDFADGMNFMYLMNSLSNTLVNQETLNQAKKLTFDEAITRGEIVLECAKKIGVKMDITPVDIVKGDMLINFSFVNQLYNLFAANSKSKEDFIKMQNECLGYLAKNINELEDLEMMMEEEISSLRENVDNLEDSLAGIVGELLVDEIAAMTGIPIPSISMLGMQALTPAEEVFDEEPMMQRGMVPQAPPLPSSFSRVMAIPAGREEDEMERAMEQAMDQVFVKEAEQMENSLQSQMMELMNQMKQLVDAQREREEAPQAPIPAAIQSEVQQANSRQAEIRGPEKEGLAYIKGVLKWKPCRLIVKDNRLLVFKAGKEKASEDIYLSEAIKITQEALSQGYYGIRLSLSFIDSVILGWTDDYLMRDWLAFLTTKVRPMITATEFVMSGQRMVPQASMRYQLVQAPAASPIPTANDFLDAIQGGDIPNVRNMLEQGADPLMTNQWGGNCLHIAAGYGNKDMTRFLLDYLDSKGLIKFLLDQQTLFDRNTPLHLGVKSDNPQLCQMLLDKGASKDLKNGFNETPVELANSRGILDVIAVFSPPAAPPPPPAMPHHAHPFLIRGAPMANYRPQMTASQSPYILPSSSPYYRYRTQPF